MIPKILPTFTEKMIEGGFKVEEHHDLEVEIVKIEQGAVTLRVNIIEHDGRQRRLVRICEALVCAESSLVLQGVGKAFTITQSYA